MNPSNVPPWGCPWHGLVKGGQLQLPNGTSMAYPQPSAEDAGHFGDTALITHPLAEAITRSTEEQAADAAAGYQWRNTAILSGADLYGKALGGWIYIDAAGDCWLVTTELSWAERAGGLTTFTLRRFGVLGGAPLEYSYSVAVPNMGQATPDVFGVAYRVARYHSSPTGSAAVFEVAALYTDPASQWWNWRPVGWLEVTLSGPGSECVIAITTLKTRVQTLGSLTRSPLTLTDESYYLQQQADGTGQIVTEPTPGLTGYRLVTHTIVSGTDLYGFAGWVVGMYYDSAGARHEVTLTERSETAYTSPAITHTGPTSFPPGASLNAQFDMSTNIASTLTFTYSVDGTPAASYVYQLDEASTTRLEIIDGAGFETYSGRVDCNPGAAYEQALSAQPVALPKIIGGSLLGYPTGYDELGDVPTWFAGGFAWCWEANVRGDMWVRPHRYSNTTLGVEHSERLAATGRHSVHQPAVVTPSGAQTLPALTVPYLAGEARLIYGSWCPVTHQAARDTAPVCWV